ncbi:MAG TPA: YIP1 family protein [Chloroflexota bacterium]|nr:YIP1 family protein [Chloroflexota bacterium]
MPIDRMIRALKLEPSVYDELEMDRSATTDAFMVVAAVAFISALGGFIGGIRNPGAAFVGLIVAVIAAVIGWIVWSYITYWIGTSLLNGTATPGELLRTLGFAYTANALGFFSFIPFFGGIIAFIGSIWALVAGIVAVRQALDFDTGKALITVVIGWVVMLIIGLVVALFGASLAFIFGR